MFVPAESTMRIDRELAQYLTDRDSVITIGVFDGVHRGHRHLINQLIGEARNTGRRAGVVTFRNHPLSVLRADFKPQYLTDFDERVRLIREQGVDFLVPITFDLELADLGPKDFVARLQEHLRMRELVVGPDFAMGHKRMGDVETLTALGEEMGFSVRVVDLLEEGGQAIRSTTIREAAAKGDVTSAAALLDRNFVLTGTVVKGVGRGKTLGFPTANLKAPQGMVIPGDGIYATWACLGEQNHMAASSIGTRPTFGESERTIESFILDFEGDLYDQQIRLEFVQRLRDEVKYSSVEDLQEQVAKDVAQTKAILRTSRPNLT